MMYWTCPYCGANLDPGEKCTCTKKEGEEADRPQSINGNPTTDGTPTKGHTTIYYNVESPKNQVNTERGL